MLKRQDRIPRKEFSQILSSRHFSSSDHFTLRRSEAGMRARFAVSVSKKVSKSAVVRNRIRRRAYSALPAAGPGLYLLVAKKGSEKVSGQELRDELAKLFKKG